MRTLLRLLALATISPFLHVSAQSCSNTPSPEYFKPLTAGNGLRYPLTLGPVSWRLLGAPIQPVKGSDGMIHLAYALQLTDSWSRTATVKSIDVVDPAKENAATGKNVVLTIKNEDITGKLRLLSLPWTLDKTNFSNELAGGQSAIVYFDVTYSDTSSVPRAIAHRVTVTALDRHNQPEDFTILSPPLALNCTDAIVLSPPFKGDGWVDGNGCCKEIGPHRFVMNSINGSLAPTEEFAIDWVRVDAKGMLFAGDPHNLKNWIDYGADLLAVGPGKIVEVVSDLPDEPPGKSPDNLTVEQIAGNRVILDLGAGQYAEYDHMEPRSATVHVGDLVTRGQKLGSLGNSGNTDAPHLHFQLMNRPSSLDGSALPFVFDSMQLQGRIPGTLAALDAATMKNEPLRIEPGNARALTHAMPLSLDVVSFK